MKQKEGKNVCFFNSLSDVSDAPTKQAKMDKKII